MYLRHSSIVFDRIGCSGVAKGSFLFHKPSTDRPSLPCPPSNLGPYEDVRHVRHAVLQLRDPLLLDVVIRGRIYDGEADQKHIRVGVGERPQLVVILLREEQRVCAFVQPGWGVATWFQGVPRERFHRRALRPHSFPDPGIWWFPILQEVKEPSIRKTPVCSV